MLPGCTTSCIADVPNAGASHRNMEVPPMPIWPAGLRDIEHSSMYVWIDVSRSWFEWLHVQYHESSQVRGVSGIHLSACKALFPAVWKSSCPTTCSLTARQPPASFRTLPATKAQCHPACIRCAQYLLQWSRILKSLPASGATQLGELVRRSSAGPDRCHAAALRWVRVTRLLSADSHINAALT